MKLKSAPGRVVGALGIFSMALVIAATAAAQRSERPTLSITGYVINAELDTQTHHIAAKAVVTFTAPENAEMVSFGFHPALKVTKITDDGGKLLTGERSADGTIRVAPTTAFVKGQSYHWTFDYDGVITGNEDGPVEGLKLAAIQEPITYLLYGARWFPTTGYMTDRFTAEMHIKVPQGLRVFASGSTGASHPVTLAGGKPGDQYDFSWTKPGFPGTLIAGRYVNPVVVGPGNVKVYLTVAHQAAANELAQTATKEYDFFTDSFGGLESSHLNVVEIPDDTLPAVWGPELAGMMGARVGDKSGVRLLANTIAHLWWGSEVSPKTLNDAWITNGMARYGELMYRGRRERQERLARRTAGRRRRRAGVRHHSAFERQPAEPVFAGVPIHDAGEGRHDLPHAALGDWGQGLSGHFEGRCSASTPTRGSVPPIW